jgi:single-stranded-DNA-specific exonuclease
MAGRQNLGLTTLCDLAGVNETPSSYHLGFVLGPRINAGGRVGKASLGTQLLSTHDPVICKEIGTTLEELNTQRKAIEAEALVEALTQAENATTTASMTLHGASWHQGIIGIVASRIKEAFHRPTLIITTHEGVGKGSGRSISGIDLGAFVHQAVHQGILLQGGGHAMAAGFSVALEQIPALRAAFDVFCQEQALERDLTPRLMIDAHVSVGAATSQLIDTLSQLEPFGMGNPTPRFILSHVRILALKPMGASEQVKHIRLEINQDTAPQARLTAVAFNIQDTPLLEALLTHSRDRLFHLAGTLKREWWQGREQIRFMVEDGYVV